MGATDVRLAVTSEEVLAGAQRVEWSLRVERNAAAKNKGWFADQGHLLLGDGGPNHGRSVAGLEPTVRYAADDEALAARGAEAGRVIFLGDSITDDWKLALSFPGKPVVIRHKAAVMVLLAGTNDKAPEYGAGKDADDRR